MLVAEVVDHQFALIHRHLAARTLLQQLLRCFDLVDVDALRVHEAKMIAFDDHHAGTIDVGRFRHHVTEPPEHVLHLEARGRSPRQRGQRCVYRPSIHQIHPGGPGSTSTGGHEPVVSQLGEGPGEGGAADAVASGQVFPQGERLAWPVVAPGDLRPRGRYVVVALDEEVLAS